MESKSTMVVNADMFNAFVKNYNDEINFTVAQIAKTIETAEKIFQSEFFEQLDDLSKEEVHAKYQEWLPAYIAGIADDIRIMNAENMSDSQETKHLRTLRMSRVATLFSMLYQIEIPTNCFAMDNVTLDVYTHLCNSQRQAESAKAVEAAGGAEAIKAQVLASNDESEFRGA